MPFPTLFKYHNFIRLNMEQINHLLTNSFNIFKIKIGKTKRKGYYVKNKEFKSKKKFEKI